MKRYLLLLTLIFPLSVSAVTLSESVTLTLPSTGDSYTLGANSTFDSLTINSESFVFTLSSGQSIKLTSADRRTYSASPVGISSGTCGSNSSEFNLSPSSESATDYTVTFPSTCGATSGGGGSS